MSYLPAFHYYSGPFLYSAAKSLAKPQTMNYLRGNSRGIKRKRTSTASRVSRKPLQTAGAKMHISRGLTIGKYKPLTTRQKFQSMLHPPVHFDSKWAFQIDAVSGRVTASTIPILTKPLIDPIVAQLFFNANTDTLAPDPTVALNTSNGQLQIANQYRVMIRNYVSSYQIYNSSSNSLRARIVWYKPKYNHEQFISTVNLGLPGSIPSSPLNLTMMASTINGGILGGGPSGVPFTPVVGDGLTFDQLSTFANWQTIYEHSGAPITGVGTTNSSTTNTVAYLDPSLVPGSPEVRALVGRHWRSVKSEDFMLEPGCQFNTKIVLKNRMMRHQGVDAELYNFKDCTLVGVVYVYGQMVFDDRVGNNTISTGSSQLSILRRDTCTMSIDNLRRVRRINLTQPYIAIAEGDQGIINTQTNNVDDEYNREL